VFYLPLIQNALAHDRLEQMRRKLPATSIPVANPVPSLAAEPTPAEPSRV
jgi:hypothetical protein